MSVRELFERYPSTRQIPHCELADLPTPAEPLAELASQMQLASLQVKRDDLTGALYGGNKLRKLEFLLADAQAKGHDKVWTVGGIGSHHCLATCLWARELGMECGVLQFPQPVTPHVQRNIRALSTTRPDVHLLTTDGDLRPDQFGARMKQWRSEHPDIYYIPGGGSSAVGVLGYVNAALEFVAQVEAGGADRPDVVVVAAGTCGTLAGLHLGFALAEFDVELRGIRVVDEWIANRSVVQRLVEGAAEILRDAGVDVPAFEDDNLSIDDRFFGPGYGVPTEDGLAVRRLVQDNEDIVLEPTYTAKTFAAIVTDVANFQQRQSRVLYWHTLSGADLSERIANADLDALPPEYRVWAEQQPDWG